LPRSVAVAVAVAERGPAANSRRPANIAGYDGRVTDRVSRAIAALKRLAFPTATLPAEERARIEDERVERNRVRIAAVLSVVVVMQAVSVYVFWPRADAQHLAFRTGVFWIHGTTFPVMATLAAAAWLGPRRKLRLAWLGDVVLVLAVGVGVFLSLNTHRLLPNINALTIALFAGALVIRPTFPGALLAYGGAAIGFAAGLHAVQDEPDVRAAHMATGITAVLIPAVFSRILDAAFARDVLQRLTIARQADELRAWNAELERRVEEQVRETLAHANEVRALDAQLRWKVRDRSRELARALRGAARSEGEIRPGQRFEHRFDIEQHIGAGAMGDVYSARDHATGQPVAIKLLRRWEGMSPADIERFVAEAAAAATVVHPAIVRTYHVDVTEHGHFYLVMELVHGRTLAGELAAGRFDAGQAARLGAVVADALSVAHAAGVIHRDIKPGNLMLTTVAPGVRVLDFGVSKLADPESAAATFAGQIMGTPHYMAPEQIHGKGELTGACDVYALGQVLYEMLTGEPCFGGQTVQDVLRAHVADAPQSVRARTGSDRVPSDLSGLIQLCLSKDPRQRPDAATLAASLRVIADTLGTPPLESIGPPRHLSVLPEGLDGGAPTLRASG
jgi:hypothetical protein